MLRRFLAGSACAAILAVVSVMPAAANPYDAQVRGSGRSLLSTLFGPSIARTVVSYSGKQKVGTIIISTAQRRLYLVLGNGQALSYAIGVGREGMAWSGVNQISAKREWPDWTPPEEMLRRRPDLPRHVTGGIDNPLGARAMYLGSTPLPDPRLERAGFDRHGGVVGLHPADQRGRDRSLQSGQGRSDSHRAISRGAALVVDRTGRDATA